MAERRRGTVNLAGTCFTLPRDGMGGEAVAGDAAPPPRVDGQPGRYPGMALSRRDGWQTARG